VKSKQFSCLQEFLGCVQALLDDFSPEQAAAFLVLLRAKVRCSQHAQH
jgi:hypothetical protein